MFAFRFSEKLASRFRQPWFGGLLGAVLAAALGFVLLQSPRGLDIGKGLRNWSYDLLFLPRSAIPSQNIQIVYLNEATYSSLKQDPANFDRSLYARLIRRLKADGAKLIVLDILFIDAKAGSEASDRVLAQAMREHGKVVIGGQFEKDDRSGSATTLPPIDALRDACAGWGIVQIQKDGDFEARLHHPGSEQVPSLAWKSAEVFGAEIARHPEARGQERWLNYYAPEAFSEMPFEQAIDEKLPEGYFKDKIVFVGGGEEVAGFAGDLREQFRSPWTWLTGHFHLGVEMHALTFCNLVQHDWLRQCPAAFQLIIVLLCGAVLGYGLSLFQPLAATGLAIGFALFVAVVSYVVVLRFNIWFPWLIPVAAQVPVALFWSYLFYSIRSHFETKLLETSLSLYLSPHQVKQIIKQRGHLEPGGKQQTVSILFSDIENFSNISERMEPNDLVRLLNGYYEIAIGCVHQTEGTVMKLIGDAIFAIWNAPQEQPDHPARACRAALLLNEQMTRFDSASAHLQLRTRVGLHTGLVCVGNIGSTTRFDYTAIGESVNIASRVEGLNKHLGTNILVTGEIQRTIEGRMITRLVGNFRFKGFEKSLEVYELISTTEGGESSEPWRRTFEQAWLHFQRRQFPEAAAGFRETLRLRPNDGPALYYLGKIDEFQTRALPAEWRGEIELAEK